MSYFLLLLLLIFIIVIYYSFLDMHIYLVCNKKYLYEKISVHTYVYISYIIDCNFQACIRNIGIHDLIVFMHLLKLFSIFYQFGNVIYLFSICLYRPNHTSCIAFSKLLLTKGLIYASEHRCNVLLQRKFCTG